MLILSTCCPLGDFRMFFKICLSDGFADTLKPEGVCMRARLRSVGLVFL